MKIPTKEEIVQQVIERLGPVPSQADDPQSWSYWQGWLAFKLGHEWLDVYSHEFHMGWSDARAEEWPGLML